MDGLWLQNAAALAKLCHKKSLLLFQPVLTNWQVGVELLQVLDCAPKNELLEDFL